MITPEQATKLTGIVQQLIQPMNVACEVSVREEKAGDLPVQAGKDVIIVAVSAPENARFLIGKNGQNLQALEHVVRTMFLKGVEDQNLALFVDVNDYKKSRATHVATLAKEAVLRVRNTQRAEVLIPMSSYERRIVHMELAAVSDVTTESIGQDPQRRIVVKPYRVVS